MVLGGHQQPRGRTAEQVTGGIKATVQLVNARQLTRVTVLEPLNLFGASAPIPFEEKLTGDWLYPRAHFLDADPGLVHPDGTSHYPGV